MSSCLGCAAECKSSCSCRTSFGICVKLCAFYFHFSQRMKESEKKAAELKAKAKQNLAVQEKAVVPDPANNANDQMPMLSQDTVHQMKQQLQIKSHQHHQNSFIPSRHQVIGNQQGVSQIQHPHAFNHTAYQAGVYVRQPPMGPSVQNPTVYSHNIIKPPTGNTAEPMMHTMQYFPSNAAMPVQYNQDYSASANAEVPSKKPSSSAHFQHNRVGKASDGAARTTVNRNPTAFRSDGSMLDLVAGFDKHAASLIPKPDIIAVLESRPSSTTWPQDSHFFSTTGVEESPYITSKSFDEMHKCLGGIDIPSKPSHLDLNATSNTRPNDDEKPILSAESPYITSKSFDDMHRCLGMSHFDLRENESPKSVKSQDNGSTESSSAYVESMPTVDINAEHRESIDPRSDKYLSAFSPFDGSRIMQDHDAPCNFDSLSQRAPLQVHQAFQTIFEPVSHTNPRYRAESQFSPSQSSTQSASMRYAAPSEYGLAKFLNKNCASAYPHAVSTGTSEQSSDRGNSSPDQSD